MTAKSKLPSLPTDYETWNAQRKQDFLWQEKILTSRYQELPSLKKINVLGLFLTPLSIKMDLKADEAPRRWQKAIHAHGSVAKIKFIPVANTPLTGLFKGVDCGLVRLSVTGDPQDRGFAPGLAMKFLIDKHPSENFSALVSLTGQGNNYNLFANEFSNIVPVVKELGPRFINWIFSRVTRFPTKLYLEDMAKIDQHGNSENKPYYPYQIFLVPNPQLKFPENPPHDFREDLASIDSGSLLFTVYGVIPEKIISDDSDQISELVDQANYRQKAEIIGTIETCSEFVNSEYGDNLLFFRHQRFGNK